MRRALALAGAASALVVAALLAPTPPAGASAGAALGRSLGGFRVVLVDALFLRAESLRRRGRAAEVPRLYETILDLDPGNEAAVDHLALTLAYDLLPVAVDAEERWGWWAEAWRLVERGLAATGDAPRLLVTSYEVLRVAAGDADLARRAADALGDDPVLLALDRLGQAAMRAPELRGRRSHLLWVALFAPLEAATRLRAGGGGAARALAVAERVLAARHAELAEMRLPVEAPGGGVPADAPRLDAYLRDAIAAVRGDRTFLDRYPATPLAEVLRSP